MIIIELFIWLLVLAAIIVWGVVVLRLMKITSHSEREVDFIRENNVTEDLFKHPDFQITP